PLSDKSITYISHGRLANLGEHLSTGTQRDCRDNVDGKLVQNIALAGSGNFVSSTTGSDSSLISGDGIAPFTGLSTASLNSGNTSSNGNTLFNSVSAHDTSIADNLNDGKLFANDFLLPIASVASSANVTRHNLSGPLDHSISKEANNPFSTHSAATTSTATITAIAGTSTSSGRFISFAPSGHLINTPVAMVNTGMDQTSVGFSNEAVLGRPLPTGHMLVTASDTDAGKILPGRQAIALSGQTTRFGSAYFNSVSDDTCSSGLGTVLITAPLGETTTFSPTQGSIPMTTPTITTSMDSSLTMTSTNSNGGTVQSFTLPPGLTLVSPLSSGQNSTPISGSTQLTLLRLPSGDFTPLHSVMTNPTSVSSIVPEFSPPSAGLLLQYDGSLIQASGISSSDDFSTSFTGLCPSQASCTTLRPASFLLQQSQQPQQNQRVILATDNQRLTLAALPLPSREISTSRPDFVPNSLILANSCDSRVTNRLDETNQEAATTTSGFQQNFPPGARSSELSATSGQNCVLGKQVSLDAVVSASSFTVSSTSSSFVQLG
ncbi:unnamed protein product, partial [Protopolystoma xenopodis]